MKAQELTSAICITVMSSLASAGVGKNIFADTRAESCRGQLTDLVVYLKETARIEGIVLSVEKIEDSTFLYYPDFSQRLQCVNGILQIDFHDPKTD